MEDSMSNSTHHSWLVAVACVALALPASAAQARTQSSSNHQSSINNQQSFDRYQVILARMPFGDEAAAAAAAEAARTADKGPPLPMELTPEMDQQLVDEGVLPPAE